MLVIAGVVSMVALAGCTPAPPEPLPIPTSATASTPSATPTPEYTPGVDPDADVAAAIATYEAYVEASNNLVVSDRDTWDPVLDLLLDEIKASSLATYEQMAARGEYFDGSATILSADKEETLGTVVRIHVCTDFSEAFIRDQHGDLVGGVTDYGPLSMNVVLRAEGDSNFGWKIGYFGESERPCS